MSKRIKLNKTVILVEPELMQAVLNQLQLLQFSTVYGTIEKLMQLKGLPVKDYTLEDNIEEEQKEEV